jgi:hypothetical protein
MTKKIRIINLRRIPYPILKEGGRISLVYTNTTMSFIKIKIVD